MQYEVRAVDAQQQVHTLRLDAAHPRDVQEQLLARGLRPLSVRAQALHAGLLPGARRDAFALALFAQELLALVEAGLSVIEAVEALNEKDASPRSRVVLTRLHADLRAGLKLSSALREQPDAFPPLFVGVVQACEGSSTLVEGLGRFVDYQARLRGVRSKLASAAIYPAILLAVGAIVSLFLMGYVVPRFASVYEGSGRELPWASALLMAWGEFVGAHAPVIAGAAVAALVAAVGAGTWAQRRGLWARWISRWPGIGPQVRLVELARLYLTLGLLLEGGLPIAQALTLAEAVGAMATRRALPLVRAQVQEGQPLSQAFTRHGLATPVGLRLLRVGEASGRLGEMLRRVARLHDEESARWIERFSRVVEPVLMAAMGLVIGLVVLLLYMPIFDLAGSLQ